MMIRRTMILPGGRAAVSDLDHPPQAMLRKLFRGELDAGAARPLIRHLLGACPACSRHLRAEAAALPGGDALACLPAAREQDYDLAINRAWQRVELHGLAVRGHQRLAKRIEALLAKGAAAGTIAGTAPGAGPRGHQAAMAGAHLARARGHRHGIALYEALLARAWAVRFDDRQAAITLTDLARIAARGLAASGYSSAQVADFKARAWGEHANALRADMRLAEAERMLGEAMDLADGGTQDVWLKARLMDIAASLLAYQRQRRLATEVLDTVYNLYLGLGDLNRAGNALINRARYLGYDGQPELAARLLAEALELIDPVRQPEIASIACHSRILFLALAGRCREARSALWKNRELVETYAGLGLVCKARVVHLEGYINAGLGDYERAERAFRAALKLLAADDAERLLRGTIALDLAVMWMDQRRVEEACELAADTARHLLAQDIPAEAAAALRLLESAIESQWRSARLFEHVVDFLRRIEHVPEARFEPWRP
jgi:tetratricopeptide (TPR) repeat protein